MPIKYKGLCLEIFCVFMRNIRITVVNSVNKFEEKHWRRVVAVFAHGPAWQFKGMYSLDIKSYTYI